MGYFYCRPWLGRCDRGHSLHRYELMDECHLNDPAKHVGEQRCGGPSGSGRSNVLGIVVLWIDPIS